LPDLVIHPKIVKAPLYAHQVHSHPKKRLRSDPIGPATFPNKVVSNGLLFDAPVTKKEKK